MRVFAPDLDDYVLDDQLGEDWVNVTQFALPESDFLTTQERLGRRYIAAPDGTDVGRVYLHRRYSPFNDHAVEGVFDRSWPWRSDTLDDELGLVVRWKVTNRESAAELIREGSSNILHQPDPFYPVEEDLSLGATDHVRFVLTETVAKVIEVRGGVSTEHFSMAIDDSLRVIAMRAAVVDSEVMFWLNPSGHLSFEDAPVTKIMTLIQGATRTGFRLGARGRMWHPRMEYQTETLGGEPAIDQGDQETLVIDPVRVTVNVDESRPPIETTLQIAHWGDTKVPERVERLSRVFLRDGRFMLRPGHTYRATGHVRTVDGQLVRLAPKVFEVPLGASVAESSYAYDAQDGLVWHPDVALPAGEVRSATAVYGWPAAIEVSRPLSSSLEVAHDSITSRMDFINRQSNRTTFSPRVWTYNVSNLDATTLLMLRQFIDDLRGRVNRFVWIHPLTGEHVLVRLEEPGVTASHLEGGATAQITLRERWPHLPLAPRDTAPTIPTLPATVTPPPSGGSSGGTSGGSSASTSGGSSGSTTEGSKTPAQCTPSEAPPPISGHSSIELCISCLGTITCSGDNPPWGASFPGRPK